MKNTKLSIIFLGVLIATLLLTGCSGKDSLTGGAVATAEGGIIKIPLDQITNTVQKYDYNANGITVTYFAVKGSDGEVRTAFDACDVCGGYKGYRQEGNDIVCNNCGQRFDIDGLGTKNKGYGCWPSFLSHTIKDGNIIIKNSELQAAAYNFQ